MEMSEILLYVKEELSCSVTLEEEDLTVESFWKNVLNEVDDIRNFQTATNVLLWEQSKSLV